MLRTLFRTVLAACIAPLFVGCASLTTTAAAAPEAAPQAAAMTWSRKVADGVTVREVEEAFAGVAVEDNLKPVGELFLSNEIASRTGSPQRFLKLYSYCDPLTARAMVDFNPQMAAFLPCRIALVEQEDGLWIHMMNMDLLMKQGGPMPPGLNASVLRVRATMLRMLERGAVGDF